jgi:hypothetical protein
MPFGGLAATPQPRRVASGAATARNERANPTGLGIAALREIERELDEQIVHFRDQVRKGVAALAVIEGPAELQERRERIAHLLEAGVASQRRRMQLAADARAAQQREKHRATLRSRPTLEGAEGRDGGEDAEVETGGVLYGTRREMTQRAEEAGSAEGDEGVGMSDALRARLAAADRVWREKARHEREQAVAERRAERQAERQAERAAAAAGGEDVRIPRESRAERRAKSRARTEEQARQSLGHLPPATATCPQPLPPDLSLNHMPSASTTCPQPQPPSLVHLPPATAT